MRWKILSFSVFLIAIAAIAILIWSSLLNVRASTKPLLTQSNIEATAVAYARKTGLQGSPTSIVSKQITPAEFNPRLDPFNDDSAEATSLVWLVVVKGDFAIAGPPLTNGNVIFTKYDNGWILLNINGEIIGQGNQSPGYEIDLNATARPLTTWPTPQNPKK